MKSKNPVARPNSTVLRHQPLPLPVRVAYGALVYLAVTALCLLADARLLGDAEQALYNLRMTLRADYRQDALRAAQKQIVLVPMSDQTFDPSSPTGIVGPPPSRRYQAKVVDELSRAGAKVIVFDVVFDASKPEDEVFAQAVRAAARRGTSVLFACLYENVSNRPRFTQPCATLRAASPYLGSIQVPQDVERPFINTLSAVDTRTVDGQRRFIPSLGLRGALLMTGTVGIPAPVQGGWQVGKTRIPTNENGNFTITYFGAPNDDNGGGVFASVPYEDVCDGIASDPFYQDNHFFRGKMVIVGDTTTLGNDVRYTPVGSMAGMEIQAHAAATALAALQRGEPFIREASSGFNALLVAICGALTCLFAFRWRLLRVALGTLSFLVGYGLLNVWLFNESSLYLHLLAPSLSILLCSFTMGAGRTVWDEREKNRVKGLLQRYVSPSVAKFILDHPERCALGGEEIVATVLFCDLRDSTQLCKELSPQVMLSLLNEFFHEMSEAALLNQGTVDKFIGDAIMVLFGAPLAYPDHAQRAVAAALDMNIRMKRLQAKWQAEGHPLIRCGISIASGPMIVGNMGSETRMDFSVLGDPVNLASRLENLNKRWNTRIIVSVETYEMLEDKAIVGGPITTAIRGVDAEVTVHVVETGDPHQAPSPSYEFSN
jgi:adenylate cyclase